MEPKEVQKYMEHLVQLLRQQFGEQLLYVGLQGSCRRGEATENSDIDAVRSEERRVGKECRL